MSGDRLDLSESHNLVTIKPTEPFIVWDCSDWGTITYLRVCFDEGHKLWGSGDDILDTEVIIIHSAKPGYAFGFYLRPSDEDFQTNLAMLSIIKDAVIHNKPVNVCYWETGKNCKIKRLDIKP